MVMNENAFMWLDKVDLVDPFFGSKEELDRLIASAPDRNLKNWLVDQVKENQRFASRLSN